MKKLKYSQMVKQVIFIAVLLFSVSLMAQYAGQTALFVVANGDEPTVAENEIINRLEEMEFDVEVIGMDVVSDAATEGVALLLISATVSSGTTAGNIPGLAALEIPVINWEPFLYDYQGFQATDGGEFNTTEIEIVDADHPIAAGLPAGPTMISFEERAVSYGMPEGDADIIAVNSADPSQVVLFCYDTGAAMSTGNAPARRVGTFLLNDIAETMTEEGWAIFDASVKWVMGDLGPVSVEDRGVVPAQFILSDNYPNPFNPITHIAFSIPAQSNVRISVWNASGERISVLLDEISPAGNYTVTFDAAEFASGLYFYRLETVSKIITKKMLFVK